MTFIRIFLTVCGWTGISRLSGVVREMILANVFGAGMFMDIYSFAIKFPNFFRRFFAEGALNAVLVPKFSNMISRDTKENVQKFANEMYSTLVIWLLIFVVVFEFAMPLVVRVVAPGLQPFIRTNVTYYARLVFPYILLISLVAYMSCILNSLRHFAWAAAISIIANVSVISALVIGKGMATSQSAVMHVLCLGVVLGGVAQCATLWINCRKHGVVLRFAWPKLTPEIQTLMKAAIPGMIGAGVIQINVFLDMAFASSLPVGAVSYLGYADRLNQLPLSLFGAALGTTLLPALSRLWESGRGVEAQETQNRALVFALMLAIPAAVGLFILARPIVLLLYGHGMFDDSAVEHTTRALKAFVFGLPSYVMMKIFATIFFANRDTRTPVIIAAVCVLVNGVLNAVLIREFAHVGIATATAIAAGVNATGCAWMLHRRKMLALRKEHVAQIGKIFLASAIMGGTVFVAWEKAQENSECTKATHTADGTTRDIPDIMRSEADTTQASNAEPTHQTTKMQQQVNVPTDQKRTPSRLRKAITIAIIVAAGIATYTGCMYLLKGF
ncbi:MAG: murein biosynthesis integral membrane protein MurJ [Holosporales bacterium]|jgi:putative peptidoglycan lipid II flippase|nr:murein biosynthesis integral membrane protein MurJ [Holosporales bacterium]